MLCGGAVQAQPEQTGWGSGYQMGTSYAGVSSGGTRLTFYCGDAAAAKANAAIKAGPYLMASLPRRDAAEGVRSLEILIDGKAVRPRSPRHAQRLGVALLPANRKLQGMFAFQSIAFNISAGHLPLLSKLGVRDRVGLVLFAFEVGLRPDR